jgi:hypothetical protein
MQTRCHFCFQPCFFFSFALQGLCVGVLSYNQMRTFDKESHQAYDALSDAEKVRVTVRFIHYFWAHILKAAREARRQRRQEQRKKKGHIPQSKSSDAPIFNFAPPPPHLLRDAATVDSGCGRGSSSAFHEPAATALDDAVGAVPPCHSHDQAAQQDVFHHVRLRFVRARCTNLFTSGQHARAVHLTSSRPDVSSLSMSLDF